MIGKIVKGISGFYYVYVEGSGIYECKARGAFRRQNIKPLVGDQVELKVLDEEKHLGNVEQILPRKNTLIRPAVANVDQALVIFAMDAPKPSLNLLDRFLVMMEYQQVPVHICFNKEDLAAAGQEEMLREIYEKVGYPLHFTQADMGRGCDEIRQVLLGKTTTVAGPSGVGKSSLINGLQQQVTMETGSVSEKIGRGKHTTRHSELIYIGPDTYIMDTPGFSSLYVPQMEKEELRQYFPEFAPYEGTCKFLGCVHLQEPDCSVKAALQEKRIPRQRYEDYVLMYQELSEKRKY
jgi:ribosome biogenesis GTPase